jgi:membrane-bound lytic murein transglycosylase D
MAAYNCGLGGVRRAIRRSGLENPDFWQVRPFLPKETRNYVPMYIATTLVAMNAEQYGFTDIQFERPFEYDVVPVTGPVDLSVVARLAGVPQESIDSLNTELLRSCTPPNVEYALRVPKGMKDELAARLQELSEEDKMPWVMHTVRRRETLRSIADQYGVTMRDIEAMNGLTGTKKRLNVGDVLRLPRSSSHQLASSDEPATGGAVEAPAKAPAQPSSVEADADINPTGNVASDSRRVRHLVRRGETLHSIAARYGVRVADLRNWNNIAYDTDDIRAGDDLVVYADASKPVAQEPQLASKEPTTVTHTVRRGETIAKIADTYSVEMGDIIRQNKLGKRARIRVGQQLKISVSGDVAASTRSAADTQEVSPRSSFTSHKVRRGESLGSIANRYGVSDRQVEDWNPSVVKNGTIYAGTTLKIYTSDSPSKGGTSAGESQQSRKRARKTYEIRSGDTLYTIAKKFGVSVYHLTKLNRGVRENNLQIGQKIKIH